MRFVDAVCSCNCAHDGQTLANQISTLNLPLLRSLLTGVCKQTFQVHALNAI